MDAPIVDVKREQSLLVRQSCIERLVIGSASFHCLRAVGLHADQVKRTLRSQDDLWIRWQRFVYRVPDERHLVKRRQSVPSWYVNPREDSGAAYGGQKRLTLLEKSRQDLGKVALEDLHDMLFGHRAHNLIRYLSALEYQKRRNASDIELPGHRHVVIDIQLYDF
jgi:hypothetical protein